MMGNWSSGVLSHWGIRAPGAVASFCCLLLFAIPVHAETINRIVATIDGEPITAYELKQFAERTIRGRQVNSSDQAMLLDALITEKLVSKEVSDKGVVVRDDDIDHYIDSIKERNKIDDEQLKQDRHERSWIGCPRARRGFPPGATIRRPRTSSTVWT